MPQCVFDGSLYLSLDSLLVTPSYLHFAGVYINVNRIGRHVDEHDGEGVAVGRQLAAVGVDDRPPEDGGGDVAVVDVR